MTEVSTPNGLRGIIRFMLADARVEVAWHEQQAKRLRTRILAYEAILAEPEPTLQSQSVHESLIAFALDNDGLLRTRDAIGHLVASGAFPTRFDANKGIQSTIWHSRRFERVSRGVYRLMEASDV